MATTQKQASAVRYITFMSTGSLYTAFLHASTGDVKQQYDDLGNYYPEISAEHPVTVRFVATCSTQTGVVVPDSIDYLVAGSRLSFDTSGTCTTPGAEGYFRKSGMDLVIIGNIAAYLGHQSAVIQAEAKKGADVITASAQITVSPWQGADRQSEVSIRDISNKAFTFRTQTDHIILQAMVLAGISWVYNVDVYTYVWSVSDASEPTGWRVVQSGTGKAGSLILKATDVDTYATVKVEVYRSETSQSGVTRDVLLGADTVGVLDASDPLDMVIDVKINRTGSGTEEADTSMRFDSTMPAGAYLLFSPRIVLRGSGEVASGTVNWQNGILTDPTGLQTRIVIPDSGKYKVSVSDIGAVPGEHSLLITGILS